MNKLFNFNRWRLLVTKHWIENSKEYILALLAISGALTIWLSLLFKVEPGQEEIVKSHQYAAYFAGLYIIGPLYVCIIFNEPNKKIKNISFLSLPASTFEKLLVMIFYSLFLFFVVYTAIFYTVDIIVLHIKNSMFHSQLSVSNTGAEPDKVINVFLPVDYNTHQPYYLFLAGYFSLQSLFLAGAVYFKRFSYLKTLISVSLLFIIFFLFDRMLLYAIIPDNWHRNNLMGWEPPVRNIWECLLVCGVPIILWFIAYFRLKEKVI